MKSYEQNYMKTKDKNSTVTLNNVGLHTVTPQLNFSGKSMTYLGKHRDCV